VGMAEAPRIPQLLSDLDAAERALQDLLHRFARGGEIGAPADREVELAIWGQSEVVVAILGELQALLPRRGLQGTSTRDTRRQG